MNHIIYIGYHSSAAGGV